MTNEDFLFFFSPRSCSLCIYMEKWTNKQGKVGALQLGLLGVLTLFKCVHFISRRGSLPLSKTFCGGFENASCASFKRVLPVVVVCSNYCYFFLYMSSVVATDLVLICAAFS